MSPVKVQPLWHVKIVSKYFKCGQT